MSSPRGADNAPLPRWPAWLTSPYLFMTLAMLFWSGNWLLGRAMHAETTPVGLNFWRWSIALVIMLPVTAPWMWAARREILAAWKILLALGLLGVALFHTLVYMALEHTTAINAALFNSTVPMVVVPLSWALYGERVTPRQLVGIGISLVGVLAIVTRGDPAVLAEIRFNPGDLFALASVPVWALYTVLLMRRPANLSPMVLLGSIGLVGVLLLSPFYAWDVARGGGMEFNQSTVLTVLYMALFASVIAFILYNNAVPRVGPNKAGLYLHLHPAFTTILAILFLGEQLRSYHAIGIALIALGIWLTSISGHRAVDQQQS